MAVDSWIFFGLIPILLLALFFYLFLRIIGAVFRGVGALLGFGGRRPQAGQRCSHGPGVRPATAWRIGLRVCPNPQCRRGNPSVARFCARCGQRL
ncbi:MAG: hypothetical protein GY842_15585 [bacterium]|nr:hypothetical protein [bacterium]